MLANDGREQKMQQSSDKKGTQYLLPDATQPWGKNYNKAGK